MQMIVQDRADSMQRDTDAGFLAWLLDNGTDKDIVLFMTELHLKF